jgi:acyl-CoA synthetase (AMP-forming)/AMP-acid ligase II
MTESRATGSRDTMRSEIGPIPFAATIPALVRWTVECYGDRVQIEDAQDSATFRQIERRSAQLARALLAQGVGKGTMIGLMLPNGPDWVTAWLAIGRIGATAVLMSTFSKAPEIAHILRHSDISLLISADRYLGNNYCERLESALPSLGLRPGNAPLYLREAPALRSIWIWGEERPRWSRGGRGELESSSEVVDEAMLAAVEAQVTPADRALIIYSSGVSAAPKAIVHTQGTVARHSWTMSGYMTFAPGDRLLTTMPLFWVGGLCTALLSATLRGTAFVSPKTPGTEDILTALRTRHVTHLLLWPNQMVALQSSAAFRSSDLSGLTPISSIQWGFFGLTTPERSPNVMGMSETFGPYSQEYPGSILPADRAGAFGRPVGDIERIIVDPVTKAVVAPGVEGEIWVRGSQLMEGYYKKERHEVFEPDGFYRTGDFGWISDDGYLFFTGRRTEMIKTGGANVAPREVEAALYSDANVIEAVALGLPDPTMGEVVVAAAVLREHAQVTESDLRERLRPLLSSFKIPRRIFFLSGAEIPRTANAKVNRSQLQQMLSERMA